VDDEANILFWLSAVVRLIVVGGIEVTGHVGDASRWRCDGLSLVDT
jgi:hypothetical protein